MASELDLEQEAPVVPEFLVDRVIVHEVAGIVEDRDALEDLDALEGVSAMAMDHVDSLLHQPSGEPLEA